MFPIGDDAPSGKYTPWMFYLIIGVNILMFLNQMSATQGFDDFIIQYGLIP
jgi:hypothetical protein